MKRYAAVAKEVDIHVYGIARQAEVTSATISHLENVFKDFTERKGKLPRRRPLPKVDALYGMIQKTASLLKDINQLIYHEVDAVVIPETEADENPERRELSAEQLSSLKREIKIAQTKLEVYTSNIDIQVTLFFGILSDQSDEELYNMVAYLIDHMKNIDQVPSESKPSGRYLAGFHPRYIGWEITRQKRAVEEAENRPRPPESRYSWDSPAVQVLHSDEDLFLHALELKAQYVKQGKTLKSLQDSLTSDQRNAIERLQVEQNRLLEEETIELQWHLAGIDPITLRVPPSYSSKPEPVSLFVILKTGWRNTAEPAILKPDEDPEGVHVSQHLEGEDLANGRVEERHVANEHVRRAPVNIALQTAEQPQPRPQPRARAIPRRAPTIFVDSVAGAMLVSDNASPPARHEPARMHSGFERETAHHTSRRARRQPREYQFERQERERRPMEYQVLGPNLAANYAKMSVRDQKRHVDTLIREWDQVKECLPSGRVQERYLVSFFLMNSSKLNS